MKRILMAATAAIILAGCSGGGGDGSSATAASNGSGSVRGQASSDAFVSRVAAVIGNQSENAEPESVSGTNATTPEDKEPVQVM